MKRVGIIGAGAAGLVAAREMIRAGFEVRVFERSNAVGGIWCYTENTDDDISGRNPQHSVWSSVYASLRTNLPRDVMAYLDYTFDTNGGGKDEWPRFPHHSLVLEYLQNFATDFGILPWIQFDATVTEVIPHDGGWTVHSRCGEDQYADEFDAVLVCNGHYAEPRVPPLDGIDGFNGEVWHSHNYRRPEPFAGKRVAVWGNSASGTDIASELSTVANVIWCGNAFNDVSPGRQVRNLHVYPSPTAIGEDGRLRFDGGTTDPVDVLMFCTGYEYQFPFLSADVIRVDDNRVHPLYQQLIPPAYPTLAFIGLPFLVIPFPLFEIQAKWFASLLSGHVSLPPKEKMLRQIETARQHQLKGGVLDRHTHKLGEAQTDYYNLLAAQCGEPPLPSWFGDVASAAQKARFDNPEGFREARFPAPGPTVVP